MNIKTTYIFLVSLLVFPIIENAAVHSAENDGELRAGVAKIEITHEKPSKLMGYSTRTDLSTGVHDPLFARAVVFENAGKRLVLVSTDIIGFYSTFEHFHAEILKKFNLKPDELFLSAIHTHSAPMLTIDKEKGHPNNIEYTKELKHKLFTVIDNALSTLIPVGVGTGVGYSPVGMNRREMKENGAIWLGKNPNGITDKEVLVMKIVKPDGNPIGVLFDYATHATSLGPDNLVISGDVLGISEQFVEKNLGKGIVAPIFAGASGNIDPWYRILPGFNTENGWIPEPVLLGTLLGEEVVHVFRGIEEVRSGGEIKTSYANINCPTKVVDEEDDKNRKKIQHKRYNRNEKKENHEETQPITVNVARVGDVAFVGISVEMLTEIGLEIKAASPFKHTFIITHCNGSDGYLAPDELYKEGGYEVWRTPYGLSAADMVVKKTLKMLYDL